MSEDHSYIASLDLLLRDPLPMSQHSCYEQRTLEAWDERALYHLTVGCRYATVVPIIMVLYQILYQA